MKTINHISVHGKQWFDKVNGNSYCASRVTIYYSDNSETLIKTPFTYGYGNYYLQASGKELHKLGIIELPYLERFCRENNISLSCMKQDNCKKSETKEWGGQ